MKKKTKWLVSFAAIFTLGVFLVACDDSDNGSDEEEFIPDNIVSLEALVTMRPDAKLSAKHVSTLFKRLDSTTREANTIPLSCFDLMGMFMMACPGAGSAQMQFCEENPLSYDLVFDGCMVDRDFGTDSGTLSVTAYPKSKDFLALTYTDMVYIVMGGPIPPVSADLDVYTFKSGKIIGFLEVGPNVFLVLGMHPNGEEVCDFMNPVTVMVDFENKTWTSDGACGLTTGPVNW